jgi:uncharacterized protein YecE (DUF72 family)
VGAVPAVVAGCAALPQCPISSPPPPRHCRLWSHDWRGSFYSADAKPGDYITQYARKLGSVEIDATFYRIPSESMVDGWKQKTPPGFIFSAKVPFITHESTWDYGDD